MKNVPINSNIDWKTVELQHEHDEMVVFESRELEPEDGLNLVTSTIQQYSIDNVTDEYTNLLLTDQIDLNDIIKIELPVNKYPEQFTTSLIANAFPSQSNTSAYLYILEELEPTPTRQYTLGQRTDQQSGGLGTWIYEQDIKDNSIYFTVTLHDENYASVNHRDNYTNVFLSVSGVPGDESFDIFFHRQDSTIPQDQQRFNYIINHESGAILLYLIANDKQYYIYPNVDTIPGTLSIIESGQVESRGFPNRCVFKFVKYNKNTTNLKLFNNWVSYQTLDDQNNLNINNTKSYFDITNNYLVNSQFYNIESEVMPVNITQLKNQLTPTGRSNRNNPFPNLRDCDHREYDKIFIDSGDLNFGYNSYEMEISLLPDLVTYFNTPQDMYPYEKININDSGLIENGAIGGDTPITSDKVFKKAANYKYNTPNGQPIDEETGVWLCSWLRSNVSKDWNESATFKENMIVDFEGDVYRAKQENTNKQPNIFTDFWELTDQPKSTWVDRYYNPKKFSSEQALEIQGEYTEYKTKFETIVEKFGAENHYIFDKKSDIVFEPGCLYAYHRVGRDHIETMIGNLNQHATHDGIEPVYKQDGSRWNNIESTLTFTGEQFLQTNNPSNITNSDFTISFEMSVDDWSKPIGSQIIGNYTNEGVGIFNKMHTTPYVTFITDNDMYMLNTNLDQLLNLTTSKKPVGVARSIGNENFTIHTSTSAVSYDTKGMLTETNTSADVVVYIDQNSNYTITSERAGLPNDYIVLEEDYENQRTIAEIVSDHNNAYPDYILTVTGNITHVPVQDIIITSQNPEGETVHVNLDSKYKYILDEYDNVYRYNINNEERDLLNVVFPFEVIGSQAHADRLNTTQPLFTSTGNKFIQPVRDGEIQYVIDCDNYTIDNDDQVWFTKGVNVYKYTLSEKQGVNASWLGTVETVEGFSARLLLLATNNYNGAKGNSITIVTDGISSIKNLVDNHNLNNSSNTVNIVEGDVNMVPAAGQSLSLSGGVDKDASLTTHALRANGVINCIKCSHDNYIYVLFDNTKVAKLDSLRNVIKTIDVTDYVAIDQVDQVCADLFTEITYESGYHSYLKIIIRESGSNPLVNVINLDLDLDLININSTDLPIEINLNTQQNISNFETIKQICKQEIKNNSLTFQLRYQSYFDTDKTYVKRITQDVSQLTPGYHHFSFSFNSNNSNVSVFIDGDLREAGASDDVGSGAAYKYSRTIHSPLIVGAEPFFNNTTFGEHLGLNNYAFAKNFSIKTFRVYNEYLNFQKIKMLSREGKDIQPITLTLPTGKRSYIDHVTKFYKHRSPGKKSTHFDISIVNSTLSSSDMQEYLSGKINKNILNDIPTNSKLNNIKWIS